MALRNQPYFPFYVQDYLTDEKLNMCSASSQGVYIKILCFFHKSDTYGGILFRQTNKQNLGIMEYFAFAIQKQIGFSDIEIENALEELLENKVLTLEDDFLFQKRMVKDNRISEARSLSGKSGGGSVINKQYGKKGYIYLLSDKGKNHKVGVSTNLQQRVYQIRSKNKLSKLFDIDSFFMVSDMGKEEDSLIEFYGDSISGEWVNLPYQEVKDKFILFHQNNKQKYGQINKQINEQNSEDEIEYENEIVFENRLPVEEEKKESEKKSKRFTPEEILQLRSQNKCPLPDDYPVEWEKYVPAITERERYCTEKGVVIDLLPESEIMAMPSEVIREYASKMWALGADGYARQVGYLSDDKLKLERQLEEEEDLKNYQ